MRYLLFILVFWGSIDAFAQQSFRNWTNNKGKTMNARYLSQANGVVKLQSLNGRVVSIPAADLMPSDQQFLKGLATPGLSRAAVPAARKAPRGKPTITNLKDEVQLGTIYFKVTQSDHFIILSTGRNGRSYAENAEDVYAATANILPKLDETFAGTEPRRFAAIMVEEPKDYQTFLNWYVKDLQQRGNNRAAQNAAALGGRVGEMGISLGDSEREIIGADFGTVALFSPGGSRNGKEKQDPFRTHVIAKQLLALHASGKVGLPFWLTNGFGYRMEIELCDETRTHMLDYSQYESADADAGGGEIITSQSFADGKKWISILKKLMRSTKGQKGDVEAVLAADVASLTPETCGYMFALSHFLLSDPAMQQHYAELIEAARESGKTPRDDALYTAFGHESLEALQEAWHTYLKSSKFR